MSAFHEAIKQIFADVDKFLKVILRNENLSKPAQKEKTKILDSLQKLYEEYENLNPNVDEGSSSSSKGIADESRFTSSSVHSSHGSEEDAESENIPVTTIKALTKPTKVGYLQKKPSDLFEKLSKGKKYCAVHKNIFYWFKKPGDKKQQGAFFLSGYEFKDTTLSDREISFELFSTRKKCHQFQVDTNEDLEEWKKAIETGMKHVEPKLSVAEEPDDIFEEGEEYEDINELANSIVRGSDSAASKDSVSVTATKPPISASTPPAIPESPTADDIYDEGCSMPAEPKKEPEKAKVALIQETDDMYDDGEVYEDVGGSTPTPTTPSSFVDVPTSMRSATEAPRSSVPSHLPPLPPSPAREPQAPALPPPLPTRGPNIPVPSPAAKKTPEPAVKKRSPKLDNIMFMEDYENLFYGIWSCIGGTMDELSFDQGDIIHILNRDLDSKDWWIGEKGGDIGLVPKTYLSPAYELVA